MPFAKNTGNSLGSSRSGNLETNGFPTCFPTQGNYWGDTNNSPFNTVLCASKVSKGHVTNSNVLLCPVTEANNVNQTPPVQPITSSLQTLGYATNIRS